jgi:hypothetical protein
MTAQEIEVRPLESETIREVGESGFVLRLVDLIYHCGPLQSRRRAVGAGFAPCLGHGPIHT